jgi:hypothetical protein
LIRKSGCFFIQNDSAAGFQRALTLLRECMRTYRWRSPVHQSGLHMGARTGGLKTGVLKANATIGHHWNSLSGAAA